MIDFAGVVVTAILAFLAGWLSTRIQVNSQVKLAREAQRETRRTQRHEYMIWLMRELVVARADYEAFLGKGSSWTDEALERDQDARHEHAQIIGKAIAACLASGDEKLQLIAEDNDRGLTPYTVKDFRDRNRSSLHFAVKRLGVIVREYSGVSDPNSPRQPSLLKRLSGVFRVLS